jgi:hypothetical protein
MTIELESGCSPQEVSIYIPYYREPNKRQVSPYAISFIQTRKLQGERHIEGKALCCFLFMAVWRAANLPSDSALCRLTFDGDADMSYEMTLENPEFVGYLIDVVSSIR